MFEEITFLGVRCGDAATSPTLCTVGARG